jgi:hypothetical protein
MKLKNKNVTNQANKLAILTNKATISSKITIYKQINLTKLNGVFL